MSARIAIGVKIGHYTVEEILDEDAVFSWIRANDRDAVRVAKLQVVTRECGLPDPFISAVNEHLRKVMNELKGVAGARGLDVPSAVYADANYPLVAVYPYAAQKPLEIMLRDRPDLAQKYWESASESLQAMHARGLFHGHIAPSVFVVVDNRVRLGDFGYAPLVERKHDLTLKKIGAALAPEVLEGGKLTKQAEVYSFAKTIAAWKPSVCEAKWYKQATNPDPAQRFPDIRKMFEEVELSSVIIINNSPKSGPLPNSGATAIVSKHTLHVEIDPPGSAEPIMDRPYKPGEMASVEAKPAAGWRFDRWSGDVESTDTRLSLPMNSHKTMKAHFVRIPRSVLLSVAIRPEGAGTVEGAGKHEEGKKVTVRALPASGWRFDHWSGAVKGKDISLELSLDADREFNAHFSPLPKECENTPARLLRATGNPWVILPFCSGLTILEVLWILKSDSAVALIAGVACVLCSSAAFVFRLRLNSD